MTAEKKQVQILEILHDVTATGKVNPWSEKKLANMELSRAYKEIGDFRKAERLSECTLCLKFTRTEDGKRLRWMSSCRVKLCPICTWRRSLKIFVQTNKIIRAMSEEKDYAYIILTMSAGERVKGEALEERINLMLGAWNRLLKYKPVEKVAKGWFRGLEITHDVQPKITKEMYRANQKRRDYYDRHGLKPGMDNPQYDTYHPHFHCILAVNQSYFVSRDYLKQDEWIALWQRALKVDYNPDLRVERAKGKLDRAVSEVAKYTVKDGHYIVPTDWNLTKQTVALLDKVINKRRFVAYGGKMKEWHKKLHLDDSEDGDLVNVDGKTDPRELDKDENVISYHWRYGYSQGTPIGAYVKCWCNPVRKLADEKT